MTYQYKNLLLNFLVIILVCTSCKKDKAGNTAKYYYYRFEVTPSDTTQYYQVSWWFHFATATGNYQKGNFVYVDSISKTYYPPTIFLQADGSTYQQQSGSMNVSLKIYIDNKVVKESEGPISVTPYVSQRIEYAF